MTSRERLLTTLAGLQPDRPSLSLVLLSIIMLVPAACGADKSPPAVAASVAATRPVIRKLGTIDCDMVETTPFVFRKRLYRVEYARERYPRKAPGETNSYFRVIDVATGAPKPASRKTAPNRDSKASARIEGRR